MTEPLIYLLGFGYGLMPIIGDVEYYGIKLPYLEFIAPGMIGVGVLFQSFFEGAFGAFTRFWYQRLCSVTLCGPVTFLEVFLGEWLWAASRGTLSGLFTGVVAASLGAYSFIDLLISLPIIIIGALVFSGLGVFTAAYVKKYDQINIPIFTLITPMFALSGTYFPLDGLPASVRALVSLMPLSALVELLRWPIAIPIEWPMLVLWLLLWGSFFAYFAYKQMFRRMFP